MDDSVALWRRAAAEAMGAFMLVFAGCGAIVTDAHTEGTLGTVGVSLVFAFVITAAIYAGGHISGAHYNPAVTVAFVLARHFPARQAAAYIGAQVTGPRGRRCCSSPLGRINPALSV